MNPDSALELINEGIVLTDRGLLVTYANRSAATILGIEEPVGRSFQDFFLGDETGAMVREVLSQLGPGKDPFIFRAPFHDRILFLRAWRDEEKILIFFHPFVPRLEIARMKADYLKGISYQIRSMVNSLMITVETLAEELGGDYRRLLSILFKETRRISQLLDDLFSIATCEMERDRLVPSPVDVTRLVRESVEGLHEAIEGKSVMVENKIPTNIGTVEGDQIWLAQVVYNLLKVLLLYSGPLDRIVLDGKGDERMVTLTFASSSEEAGRISEEAFRGVPVLDEPKSIDTLFQTGLELPIVRLIVDLSNGSIGLSHPDERGAVITVTLPRTRDHGVRVEGTKR
jgi:signal transduction histidine kinase